MVVGSICQCKAGGWEQTSSITQRQAPGAWGAPPSPHLQPGQHRHDLSRVSCRLRPVGFICLLAASPLTDLQMLCFLGYSDLVSLNPTHRHPWPGLHSPSLGLCLQPRCKYPTVSPASPPTQNVQDKMHVLAFISSKSASSEPPAPLPMAPPSIQAAALQPSLFFSVSSLPHPIQLHPWVCTPLRLNYILNPGLGMTCAATSLFQAPPSLPTQQPKLLLCSNCSQGGRPAVSVIKAVCPPHCQPSLDLRDLSAVRGMSSSLPVNFGVLFSC